MMKMRLYNQIIIFLIFFLSLRIFVQPSEEQNEQKTNHIKNGDFQGEIINSLPKGWVFKSPRPSLSPKFCAAKENNRQGLFISGNGNKDCVGWVSTNIQIEGGKTYWFRVYFKKNEHLNPIRNLQFLIITERGIQGIAEFHRLGDDWVEGEARICFPGEGKLKAEVKILYRFGEDGTAWIKNISLTETEPLMPRWVRVACTDGPGSLEEYGLKAFSKALDAAGEGKADLVLLPEYFSGEGTTETLSGPSATLMSEKAKKYHMYVAGTIGRFDIEADRLYNTALIYDRNGKLIGSYDKIHLYGPELHWDGVTPGTNVPIFKTDFGKVAFMTCYDSWFTDVAELAALKGADILLFPNLGYDRGLMHARSFDNFINIVTSTRSGKYGVWDILGRDIVNLSSESDKNSSFKDLVQLKVANMGLLMVTIDLNFPEVQEMKGGSYQPVPRSRRHSGNQKIYLEDEIKKEKSRWWIE